MTLLSKLQQHPQFGEILHGLHLERGMYEMLAADSASPLWQARVDAYNLLEQVLTQKDEPCLSKAAVQRLCDAYTNALHDSDSHVASTRAIRAVVAAMVREGSVRELELEVRAQNAERALEQLQDEVVALRIKAAGSMHHSELSKLIEYDDFYGFSQIVDVEQLVEKLETAERAAAATPATEGGRQAELEADGTFVVRDVGLPSG